MADIRTTGVLDDFNRPDESPLSDGGKWSQTDSGIGPALVLHNHGATHVSPGVTGSSYWNVFTTDGDMEVWGVGTGGGAPGIAWALDMVTQPGGGSTADGYRFRMEQSTGGTASVLYRFTNAGFTQLASSSGWGSGGMMLIRRVGNNIECWDSTDGGSTWTNDITVTDTTYMTGMYVGCGIRDNSGSQLLDWTSIGGGAPVTFVPQIYRRVTG